MTPGGTGRGIPPRIWFLTTCMGRRAHLRRSLGSWLGQPAAGWVVVDYSCPQGSGAWVRRRHPGVRVVEVPGQRYFNHSRARNAGFRSLAEEARPGDWLCFVDADTRLSEGFVERVAPLLADGTFVTGYDPDGGRKGLGGLLLVTRRDFEEAGCYDESIEGYGTNGSEMRVRLFFHGLDHRVLPDGLAEHVPHGHGPRISRYPGDRRDSLLRNSGALMAKIERWEGETGREVPRELYRKDRLDHLRRQRGTGPAVPLPSFSIVVETDNLAGRESLDDLERTLLSLDLQSVPPGRAREVLLMVRPADLEAAAAFRERFPWLQPRALPEAPAGTQGYYFSKMAGTAAASGEVVVFFDSDCRYHPRALEHLLSALAEDPDLAGVSGETYVELDGVHSLAMAIAFVFDRPTGRREVYPTPTNRYIANNVAFRRQALLDHPVPHDLPCYRVSHGLHARRLKRHGLRVLRQPRALSVHPPPSPAEMARRFVLKGYDSVLREVLLRRERGGRRPGAAGRARIAAKVLATRYRRWVRKTARILRREPRQLVRLPLALPLVAYAGLAFAAGVLATTLFPHAAHRRLFP